MKILKVELTDQECKDILTTAIESAAIQYWACDDGPISIWRDKDDNVYKARFTAENGAGERKKFMVTLAKIRKGVKKILCGSVDIGDDIVASILDDDVDQEAADCIIQAAIFGSLVYG